MTAIENLTAVADASFVKGFRLSGKLVNEILKTAGEELI